MEISISNVEDLFFRKVPESILLKSIENFNCHPCHGFMIHPQNWIFAKMMLWLAKVSIFWLTKSMTIYLGYPKSTNISSKVTIILAK